MRIESLTKRERHTPIEDPNEVDLESLYAAQGGALAQISARVDRQAEPATVNLAKSEVASSAAEETLNAQFGAGQGSLIRPIYDPSYLTKTIEGSSELRQVIACMVANTVMYGWRLVPRLPDFSAPEGAMEKETIDFENFATYASEGSLLRVLEELAWDFYLTGNAWVEIVRNDLGEVVGLYRTPSYTMLMSKREAIPYTAEMQSIRRTPNGYTVRPRIEQRRFRRYAQANRGTITISQNTATTGINIWFKEFQDPRNYNRETGELITNQRELSKQKRRGNLANEMVHISSPATRGPYGFPYYIGNLVSIVADISIDNTNLSTLENNMIPSMVVTVSGNASLSKGSWKRITEFTRSKFVGKDNRSRFLVLSAQPIGEVDEDNGNMRVDIKSLHETQKDDQMFQDYSENARASIRRAFRIPELLVGRGSASSGQVVAASMKLADEQIFAQDRDVFVDWINRKLLPEMGIAHQRFELNSPNATDPDTLVRLLQAAERTGALTPEISRMIMERILSTTFPEFASDFRSDVPFTLTMAEAVKRVNEAGRNNPSGSNEPVKVMTGADQTIPGQTVTADPGNVAG